MFYSFALAVAAGNVESNKAKLNLDLSAGVIHQVDIEFPDTSDNDIRVQIFNSSVQLWPTNRGGAVRGDAAVISFRDFYEIDSASNILRAEAWLTDAAKAGTIFINIGVLPRSILQPFSLAELLRAVQKA